MHIVTCGSAANLPPRFVLQKKLETQKNCTAQGRTREDKRELLECVFYYRLGVVQVVLRLLLAVEESVEVMGYWEEGCIEGWGKLW